MSVNKDVKKITTHTLQKMKAAGEKISMITAYDFSFAKIFDTAGIEIILVGDSASNVMAGHETTPVSYTHLDVYKRQAVERTEFYAAFRHTNYWLMIPVLIMSLLSHLSRSMRWKLLMEPLDYNPALRNVFAVTMVGYLANAAIPRLGEVLKCSFLARYEKLKIDKLFGTILVERTFDLICYVCLLYTSRCV